MVFLRQSAHQLAVRSLWLVLPLCLVAVDAYAQGVPIELGISFVVIELRHAGMVVAIVFFHEEVSLAKWIGVGLIVGGCCLIAK